METALGVDFQDRVLLQQALVHRSYLNENPGFPLGSNERLEFLGDAVLGFVVTAHLYREFPELSEGQLTNLRAALVRARLLARLAGTLGLGQYLYMGHGEEASGGRVRPTLLARTLEALIGAIFLDRGLESARAFILRRLGPEIERIARERPIEDHKSRLQEIAQAVAGVTPTYHTIAARGPDHAREFTVEVRLGERVLAEGHGRSKREAAQAAAHTALESWASEPCETS